MDFQTGSWRNTYYGMRHGESIANTKGIINGDPTIGTIKYGLTEEGKEQVLLSVQSAMQKYALDESVVIYTSDFERTLETAGIVQRELNCSEVFRTEALRERSFGVWEGKEDTGYNKIYASEKNKTAEQANQGIESPDQVKSRTQELIIEIEEKYVARSILLISHGDTLSVIETIFAGNEPIEYKSFASFEKAEIKKLFDAR